jgi:hypothetical protein
MEPLNTDKDQINTCSVPLSVCIYGSVNCICYVSNVNGRNYVAATTFHFFIALTCLLQIMPNLLLKRVAIGK